MHVVSILQISASALKLAMWSLHSVSILAQKVRGRGRIPALHLPDPVLKMPPERVQPLVRVVRALVHQLELGL